MKNEFEIRGDVTAIFIKSKRFGDMETLISTSKLAKMDEFPNTWVAQWNPTTKGFYAVGSIGGKANRKRIMMHRFLTDVVGEFDVDHHNGDTLDNKDKNLRILTRSENGQNRKSLNSNNKSGVRGVSWCESEGTWKIYLTLKRKPVFFGSYKDLEKAKEVAEREIAKLLPYSQ